MPRFWQLLVFTALIGLSSQKEALTDESLQRKFLATAQCEAIHEHMCPSGLCSVKSALSQTIEHDDSWTPAQNFCDAVCLSKNGCRTVCKCANKRIGRPIPFLSDNELEPRELTVPRLHCREPSIISIKWDLLGNGTDNDVIVFAVEMHVHGDPDWKPYSLTRKNIAVIEGLLPLQIYRFRVSAVGPSGIIDKSPHSESISTLPPASDFQSGLLLLDPPVSVEPIGPIEYTNESASVRIGWKPGQDATCTYELMWYTDEPEGNIPARHYSESYNVAESPMEAQLKNLALGHTYYVNLTSLIERYEVESTEKIEMTPLVIETCLAAFNHSLAICRPPAPSRLNISVVGTIANFTRVLVSWAAVTGRPTGYNVSLFGPKMKFLASRVVPGTDTSAVFENVPAGTDYHAKVRAYSAAGQGAEAIRMVKVGSSWSSESTGAADITWSLSERTSVTNPSNDTEGNGGPVISVERAEPSNYLIIYLSVGVAVLVAVFVVIVVLCTLSLRTHRKKSSIPQLQEQVERGLEQGFDESSDFGERDLHLNVQIGEGAFGTVWFGLLSDPNGTVEVAVKMLKENPTAEESRHFENEMSILRSVKLHPNVVRFIGCVTHPVQKKKIVMEFCKYGDLQKFLNNTWRDLMREEQKVSLNYSNSAVEAMPRAIMYHNCPALANNTYGMILGRDRVKFAAELVRFARQVASGMEFLAKSNIIHRDLAARNVLIAGDWEVRISDFGLSREVLESSVYRKLGCERVAVKWMAPEAFESRTFTEKSDVWSYGVLLWEIATLGSSPYAPEDNVLEFLRRGRRMSKPATSSDDLYGWMLRCWEKDPDHRPTFQNLRENMENLALSEEQHIFLDHDKIATLSSIRSCEFEDRD